VTRERVQRLAEPDPVTTCRRESECGWLPYQAPVVTITSGHLCRAWLKMARHSRLSKSRPSKSRPAKMGRKWTQDDVLAYKIKVVYQDLETFFGMTELPNPNIEGHDRNGFTAQDFAAAKGPWTSQMLRYINYVTRATEPDKRESTTLDFVRELFDVLHYSDVAQKWDVLTWVKPRYLAIASQGRPPQMDASASCKTVMIFYWSSKWTGTRAGSIRRPDLCRIPLLPSITTTQCA
jgi:hypothetical protein